MKKLFLIICILVFGGCATLSEMNSNMQATNELMRENIQTVEASRMAVEANTKEIELSTKTMKQMQTVLPILLTSILIIGSYLVYKFLKKVFVIIKSRNP